MTNYYIASYTIDKKTDKNLETIIEKYYKKHGVLMSKSSCVRLLINSSVDKFNWDDVMAKFTKFAIAPSGLLVYRSTGKKAPTNYTIKNKTVYHKGRKIGNVGKGTIKEQKNIAKIDKKRKIVKPKIIKQPHDFTFSDLAEIKKIQPYINEPAIINVDQQSLINYSSAIDSAVNSGFISREEGNDLFSEFEKSNRDERAELWDSLEGFYEEIGFDYFE